DGSAGRPDVNVFTGIQLARDDIVNGQFALKSATKLKLLRSQAAAIRPADVELAAQFIDSAIEIRDRLRAQHLERIGVAFGYAARRPDINRIRHAFDDRVQFGHAPLGYGMEFLELALGLLLLGNVDTHADKAGLASQGEAFAIEKMGNA